MRLMLVGFAAIVGTVAIYCSFIVARGVSANPATITLSADPVSITPDETSLVTLDLTSATDPSITPTPVPLPCTVPFCFSEYPVSGSPSGIAAGPDDALWFTEGGRIGRLTTSGVLTEYPVTNNNSSPTDIATGPDGALWFTGYTDKIGRITTDGTVTYYSIPERNSAFPGIVAGPDGAFWFTETSTNDIGRITTDGTLTEFAIPTADSMPSGIAVGSDGALWFAESNAGKVGRITTSGAISEFPTSSQYSSPVGIAAGPDGALWFTEGGTEKVGRITTDGTMTEYGPIGVGGNAIATGDDGALWVSEGSRGKIARVSSQGAISEYSLPDGTQTEGIATGPDGALWFTEIQGVSGQGLPQQIVGEIGRIATPTPESSLMSNALAGATSLAADNTGFAARDEIVINPGGADEEYSVVNSLGSLDLAAPLQFAHSAGEHVVRVATNIKPGDADCSGTVGVNDAISVLRRAAAVTPYDHCVAAGNVACLDGITARDALDILLHLANVGVNLPVGCPSLGP